MRDWMMRALSVGLFLLALWMAKIPEPVGVCAAIIAAAGTWPEPRARPNRRTAPEGE